MKDVSRAIIKRSDIKLVLIECFYIPSWSLLIAYELGSTSTPSGNLADTHCSSHTAILLRDHITVGSCSVPTAVSTRQTTPAPSRIQAPTADVPHHRSPSC